MQEVGNAMDEDVDILTERQRVAEGDADQDTLCLKNLHKTYGSKVNICEGCCNPLPCCFCHLRSKGQHNGNPCCSQAGKLQTVCPDKMGWWLQVVVNSICLGVHRGERFGLLGPNGAGDGLVQPSCYEQ